VKLLVLIAVVAVAAIQHVSTTPAVRAWQEREAARLECAISLSAGREDLAGRYCLAAPR
jgi:hypothetical protein